MKIKFSCDGMHKSVSLFAALTMLVAIVLASGSLSASSGAQVAPTGAVNASPSSLTVPLADRASVSSALSGSPVMFIENAGQFADGARFQIRGGNGTIWLAENALWVTVLERSAVSSQGSETHQGHADVRSSQNPQSEIQNRKGVNLRISFPGANLHPRLEPFNRLETHVSYFLGNDPAKWRPDVPVWGGVRYVDLYPGIDLEITGENGRMVQRMVVQPGANLSAVRLRVEGADAIELLPSALPSPQDWGEKGGQRGAGGEGLRLTTAVGEFTLPLLQAVAADGSPLLRAAEGPGPALSNAEGARANEITAPFTSAPPLPSPSAQTTGASDLLYATFLGGSLNDWGYGIAVDGSGAVYVTGETYSSDFPTTPGAFKTTFDSYDAFMVKLNVAGTGLVYATFLGGNVHDRGYAIAVDGSGAAYVAGYTMTFNSPSNFPTTPGAFQTTCGGGSPYVCQDAFVTKLNAVGNGLVYSTFLGGGGDDVGSGIAIDGSGAAYITGLTVSSDFPTTVGAFQTTFAGGDAFVVKLNSTGSALAYATFLGGSDYEWGYGIAVDGGGAAYVTGYTSSPNFPTTPGAFQTTYGSVYYQCDAFVTKLNMAGSELVYSTYLGGVSTDQGRGIAIDGSGAAYITGRTASSNFPTTPGAFDVTLADAYDAFVTKLNPFGNGLVYSTFLGGNGDETGFSIAVDGSGAAHVTGYTGWPNFPTTPGAFQTTCGGGSPATGCSDTFVTKLNAVGTILLYSTFLGGISDEAGGCIAVDGSGAAYIAGWTGSSNFPTTPGAFDMTYNGAGDAFVAKLTMRGAPGPTPVPASPGSLRLIAASSYNTAQPIAPTVGVGNPTGTANAYTVVVSLLQGGATLGTQLWDVTVPGGGSETKKFNFGTRPAGRYRLRAELWLGGMLRGTQEVETGVLVSEDQARALRWVDLLTEWSYREFKQGADLVVDTDVDSLSRTSSELANYLFGKLLTEWIGALGRAIGMGNDDINRAASTIDMKLLGFKELVAASLEQLRPLAQQKVDAYLSPERQKVENKQQVTADFLISSDFHWSEGLAATLHAHGDAILNVAEAEPISRGILPPPRFIGPSTLAGQRATWEFYNLYGKIWSALALAAAVAVILVAVFASAGTLAGLIPGLAALRGHARLIALGVTGLLLLIAIGMDLNFERVVAPAITREHAMALDLFQAANQMATGISFDIETSVAQVGGREVSLVTNLRNTAPEKAQPLVETYVYSPDGRVVRIISTQPILQPGQNTLLHGQAILPRGSYRAISAIHTRERFGLISRVLTFDVTGPQVQLGVSLADSQLSLGEALHAAIFITNTNPMSNTGDVAIMAISTDEQNFNTWVVNLAPGASQRLEYSFVPQTAGSYVLQVNATDGYELLAHWDTAYIVGDGPSLALNYSARSTYDPGIAVTFPITAINGGNLPTSTVFSLVTMDRLRDLAAVYTDTIPLSVAAGASLAATATALPATQAKPGLYTARLFLGDNLYTGLDFAVAAEDTLFADIYPDNVFHAVGDAVTLTVQVMNSVYTYTDALVAVSIWRPDGVTQTVAMNPIGTGQYQGAVTAPITGTYLATVDVSKPNYRTVGNSTFFVAGNHSQLLPTVDGRPILGTTQPVTVTVRNERGTPIEGATMVVSGTMEYLSRQTDAAGQAVLQLFPTITESYQISLEKLGFAQTLMDMPVWVAPDTTPPTLFLDVPFITNRTPLTITGLTEGGANLTINSQAVAVDTQGRFTTTVALSEGANTLNVAATDAASNTTTLTRAVTLDTVSPTLTVTYPPDNLITASEVVSVTGSTEVSASVTVSGTLAMVNPASGDFNAWVLLQPGVNTLPVVAVDAAGNVTTVTRSVIYSIPTKYRIYLPLLLRNYKPARANFTASPTVGLAPLTVVFANTSSGNYTTSLWHFGDGVTSTLRNPTHIYTVAGAYTVTLTVSGAGETATAVRANYITVREPPLVADFIASPTSGVAPLTVVFTDTSTGLINYREWSFGDGQSLTGTLISTSHTYTTTGVYTVSLTVSGPGGMAMLIRINYISVYASLAELITNGSFETDAAWEFGATSVPATYTNMVAHTGQRSVRLGIVPPVPDRYSYSSVSQLVTIPVSASRVTLSFWYWPQREGGSAASQPGMPDQEAVGQPLEAWQATLTQDAQYAILLNNNRNILRMLLSLRENRSDWQFATFDLSMYVGRTIYVYFGVVNNGDVSENKRTWMYVDDVSLTVTEAALNVEH